MATDGLAGMPGKTRTVMDGAVTNAAKQYGAFVVPPVLFAVVAVVVVIQFRAPFKVVGVVIAWVLILMVHLRQIVGIGDKRKCDKAMDCHTLALPTE